MPSYITTHRLKLARRHYVTTASRMWFNFYPHKLRTYVTDYGDDFCLVINCSRQCDDAFILPFHDFRDFFTPAFLQDNRRWHGYIRADDEAIRLTPCRAGHERLAHEYHNAFHFLQGVPLPLPSEADLEEFA